eukprot:5335339-Pyramimonas_sp.AAC.1
MALEAAVPSSPTVWLREKLPTIVVPTTVEATTDAERVTLGVGSAPHRHVCGAPLKDLRASSGVKAPLPSISV